MPLIHSGVPYIQRMHYAIQTVNNSTVLVNDTGLYFPVRANSGYAVKLQLEHISPAAADIRVHFTAPAASTGAMIWMTYNGVAYGQLADTIIISTQGTEQLIYGELFLHVDNTPGTCQLQWAQGTATVGDTQILTGSNLIAFKVG